MGEVLSFLDSLPYTEGKHVIRLLFGFSPGNLSFLLLAWVVGGLSQERRRENSSPIVMWPNRETVFSGCYGGNTCLYLMSKLCFIIVHCIGNVCLDDM